MKEAKPYFLGLLNLMNLFGNVMKTLQKKDASTRINMPHFANSLKGFMDLS